MNSTLALHGHKKILIVDNDESRSHQMATVLSFVGEHYVQCRQDQVAEYIDESEHLLTVILSGELSSSTVSQVKSNPKIPFLLHDALDPNALSLSLIHI